MKSISFKKGTMLTIMALSFCNTKAQSTASIALDKMNVLYIGIDNPVSVAASNTNDDKVGFSITGAGGSFTKVGIGKYIVRVTTPTDDCWINLNVSGKLAGKSKFRVRNVPRPIAQVGPYESGSNVPAGGFKAQAGVAAFSPNFPFEMTYKVTSFTITADSDDGYINEAQCQGNTWSTEARRIINALKAGKTVMIDEIRVVGPDGKTQRLPSLVYFIR